MLILPFAKISKHDAASAGGKGASLGEMTVAGIPVPPGFVILASTFERFLKEGEVHEKIDSVLHLVDVKAMHTVEAASSQIQAIIMGVEMPSTIASEITAEFRKLKCTFVAVRSSATAEDSASAAWAGQLDSFLNTTAATLLENVKRCWASLFTPRAIFYRHEKNLHETHISVAVVVQKMVASEVSGIGFSVHPVTQDYNQLIIEAGFGLGEAIVSGQITPDSYVVEKDSLRIGEKTVAVQRKGLFRGGSGGGNEWRDVSGREQKLTDEQILGLSMLIISIEKHYGFPVDVEWAFAEGRFYIVQSRPITTLQKKEVDESEDPLFIGGTKWFLTVTRNMSFWHQYLTNLGHYYNTKDFAVDAILEIMTVTINGTETSAFVHQPNAGDVNKKIIELITSKNGINKLKQKYEIHAEALLNSSKKCLSKLTLENWKEFQDDYQKFTAGLYFTVVIGRGGGELLFNKLNEAGFKESEIPEIIAVITYPIEHTPLFQSREDLLSIGRKIQKEKLSNREIEKELSKWLEKHQHIPVNFCEEPWTMEHAKKQLEEVLNKDCDEELKAFEKSHNDRLKKKQDILRKINREEIFILANVIAEGTNLNEFRKNVFSRVSLEYRSAFRTIAKKGGSDNWRDVYYLKPEETVALLEGKKISIPKIMQERKFIAMYVNSDGKIVIVDNEKTKALVDYVHSVYGKSNNNEISKVEIIKGSIANNGKVKGIVKVILSSKDFDKMESGNILVTTMTSVDFVAIMGKAAAFVTNEGGITSHASIVAREMNKPCIIGTQIATRVLKDGDYVEVDAEKGVVTILNRAQRVLMPSNYQLSFKGYGVSVLVTDLSTRMFEVMDPLFMLDKGMYYQYFPQERAVFALEWGLEFYLDRKKFRLFELHLRELCAELKERYGKTIGKLSEDRVRDFFDLVVAIAVEYGKMNTEFTNKAFLMQEKNPVLKENLARLMKIKDEMRLIVNEMYFEPKGYLQRVLGVLSTQFGVAVTDLDKYTCREIRGLFEGEKVSSSTLKGRSEAFVINCSQKQIMYMEGEKAREIIGRFEEKVVDALEVRGQCANKGTVRGVVRVIPIDYSNFELMNREMEKMKQGEILVAENTAPELMVACRKAAAIITDLGGMLSHAAIVSREFGIPCIVGTKTGSKVLKSGDLVEVDAEKGVVRILKKKIKEEGVEWYHLGKWVEPALAAEVWLNYGEFAQQFFTQKLDGKILYLNGDFFLSQHDVDIIKEESYTAAKNKNTEFFERLKKVIIRVATKITANSKKITLPIDFLHSYQELTGVWMPLNIVSIGVEQYVTEVDPKAFTITSGKTIEKPWTLQQVDEMRELKREIGKVPQRIEQLPTKLQRKVRDHVKKYEWKGSHHFSIHTFTVDELLKQMRDDNEREEKKVKTSSDYCIELLDLMGFIRFRCAEASGISSYYLSKHLEKLAKQNGLLYEDIVEHTLDEIKNGKISAVIAQERKKNVGFLFESKEYILTVDEIKEYSNKLIASQNSEVNEIRGTIACKGRVEGKVKIVRSKSEMKEFKKGMILVAYETTPDIIPAMRMAGAIVTDFGGLTSHAAIVAREFGIPCIVGTGNATKVLKDGDLVEVDGKTGNVNIITKK